MIWGEIGRCSRGERGFKRVSVRVVGSPTVCQLVGLGGSHTELGPFGTKLYDINTY